MYVTCLVLKLKYVTFNRLKQTAISLNDKECGTCKQDLNLRLYFVLYSKYIDSEALKQKKKETKPAAASNTVKAKQTQIQTDR